MPDRDISLSCPARAYRRTKQCDGSTDEAVIIFLVYALIVCLVAVACSPPDAFSLLFLPRQEPQDSLFQLQEAKNRRRESLTPCLPERPKLPWPRSLPKQNRCRSFSSPLLYSVLNKTRECHLDQQIRTARRRPTSQPTS